MNIYELRRYGTWVILAVAVAMVGLFLLVSSRLVRDLTVQERERMEVWASATREMAKVTTAAMESESLAEAEPDIEFLLSILTSNHTIPVILADADGNILDQRNFDLPDPIDTLAPYDLSVQNLRFLEKRLASLAESANVITIDIPGGTTQYVYYEESSLLKRLGYYPYVQLLVMLAFIAVVYYALNSTKRAEQNKVWVGLSKETAHQLGTPISSLMAWMELLQQLGVDPETVGEMNKDVNRLSTIASRFSKIGSRPVMEAADLNTIVAHAAAYMATRISSRIKLTVNTSETPIPVEMSAPLFEWVMENLIKNAVDAMDGSGSITVTVSADSHCGIVSVADTGKGIHRKNYKTIFNPGYTTKTRGWGLGLALARRIIDQYHRGHICVAESEIGKGTTFRIELPLAH
ncbi:MAG: ATP-binding protein [Muribaculaceae bacterium]|nr:ATP-binding protein [Muribaculaceae bacterium]